MCDNTIFFDTLNPQMIDDTLISFQLSFYHEEGLEFFAYSSFTDWLEKYQLSSVRAISKVDKESVQMYFRQYVDPQFN